MKVCPDFYMSDLHRIENCSACKQLNMIPKQTILDDISELLAYLKKKILMGELTENDQDKCIVEIDQMQQRIAATKK